MERIRMQQVRKTLHSLWAAGLEAGPSPRGRQVQRIWLTALYLVGIAWFIYFFNGGAFPTTFEDWFEISGPRLTFLQDAVRSGQLPLHMSSAEAFHDSTTRFLTVPDTILSPQVLLLRWLDVPTFFMAHVLLLYTLGFLGLLFLGRRLRLAPISFTLLFFLFNFNGHILAHFSVGHDSWGGTLLFPWFAVLVIQLLDGDHSWSWTLKMALLLFGIWLQGSYHQYLYLLMLLGLVGIFYPRSFWTAVRTGFFTLCFCALRIMPAALLSTSYSGKFINGFPTLYNVWEGLAVVLPPEKTHYIARGLGRYLGSHELTYFVGIAGALLVVYFGLYRGLLDRAAPFRRLSLPLLVLALLGMAKVFEGLRSLPIPMLQGERAPVRIFAVVLLFLVAFAAERFQRWMEGNGRARAVQRVAALPLLGLVIFDLWQDSSVWRIPNAITFYDSRPFDPARWYVANDISDTLYLGMIAAGLAISLLTLAVLAGLAWRERRLSEKAEEKAEQPALPETAGILKTH